MIHGRFKIFRRRGRYAVMYEDWTSYNIGQKVHGQNTKKSVTKFMKTKNRESSRRHKTSRAMAQLYHRNHSGPIDDHNGP
jgi:hypothetical protein